MAMAASYFPNEPGFTVQNVGENNAQVRATLRDHFVPLGQANRPQAAESPSLPLSMATMRRLISVGLTPLMRLAWPNVRGFI